MDFGKAQIKLFKKAKHEIMVKAHDSQTKYLVHTRSSFWREVDWLTYQSKHGICLMSNLKGLKSGEKGFIVT